MGTDTYTRDDVKKFLSTMVCAEINPEKAEGKAAGDKYHVRGFPTFILEDPAGNKLLEDSGKPAPDQFIWMLAGPTYTKLQDLARSGDMKALGKVAWEMEKWFLDTEWGKGIPGLKKQHEADAAFNEGYAAAQTAYDEALKKAREDAAKAEEAAKKAAEAAALKEARDLLDQASQFSKQNKRKDAIEIWKKIIAKYPNSPEAKTARDRLKFFGVKVDDPPKDPGAGK